MHIEDHSGKNRRSSTKLNQKEDRKEKVISVQFNDVSKWPWAAEEIIAAIHLEPEEIFWEGESILASDDFRQNEQKRSQERKEASLRERNQQIHLSKAILQIDFSKSGGNLGK